MKYKIWIKYEYICDNNKIYIIINKNPKTRVIELDRIGLIRKRNLDPELGNLDLTDMDKFGFKRKMNPGPETGLKARTKYGVYRRLKNLKTKCWRFFYQLYWLHSFFFSSISFIQCLLIILWIVLSKAWVTKFL